MTKVSEIYEFSFRGLLAEAALDREGRRTRTHHDGLDTVLQDKLSVGLLDSDHVRAAQRMAVVYTVVAAFENTVRELVAGTMLEAHGEDWWEVKVSNDVRKRADKRQTDEEKHRFHTQRGESPINYTELKDLLNIIRANWDDFEPYLPSPEWARSVFDAVERSRNVIMHSGTLAPADIDRVGIHIRDWVTQVGT